MVWSLHAGGRRDRVVRGKQPTIDRCKATAYYGSLPGQSPRTDTLWLAGHDYCGYATWSRIPVGTVISLRSDRGRIVRYRVEDRVHVPRQGGSSAGLVHHDLMLQTCEGSGTSITYATRI